MSSRLEACRPRCVLAFFASRETDIRSTMLQLKDRTASSARTLRIDFPGGHPDSVDRHSTHCRCRWHRRVRGGREAANLPGICCRVNLIVPGRPGDSQGENENVVVAEAARRKRAEAALPQDQLFSSPPASYETLMSSRTVAVTEAEEIGPAAAYAPNPWTFLSLLLLSGWCGLIAGLLEVATIVIRKQVFDTDRLLRMSRHFVWLVPVSNVAVFLVLGLLGCGIILIWPRRGRWLCTCAGGVGHLAGTLGCLFKNLQPGMAGRGVGDGRALVPLLERSSRVFRRFFQVVFRRPSPSWQAWEGRSGWATRSNNDVKTIGPCRPRDAERSLDRAGHRRGAPPEPAWVRTAHQPEPDRACPPRIRSIPLVRLHPGPCHLMRPCLRGVGCTNSRSAGSRLSTGTYPRWRSFSATEVTPRPASLPIWAIAPRIRACPRFHAVPGLYLPRTHRLQDGRAGESSHREHRAIIYYSEDWLEAAGILSYTNACCVQFDRCRSQGGRRGQSRVP